MTVESVVCKVRKDAQANETDMSGGAMAQQSPPDRHPAAYAPERRRQIEAVLEQKGRASVVWLAHRFGVSLVTIRQDLESLEGEGRLIRTHGGAIAPQRTRAELAFDVREQRQLGAKRAIGAAAAAMVSSGDSIALDASTTALYLARNLRAHRELSIVTNGLHIAAEMAALPGITVLMPGGRVRSEAFSLVGSFGGTLLAGVNIQKAFLGAVGLALDVGLTDVTEEEAEIKRAMIASSRQVIAVVDHTKWDRVGLATFCPLEQLSMVISDTRAPRQLVEALRARGIEVVLVDPMTDSDTMPQVAANGTGGRSLRRGGPGRRQQNKGD